MRSPSLKIDLKKSQECLFFQSTLDGCSRTAGYVIDKNLLLTLTHTINFPQISNARYWSRKIPLIVDYFEEEMSTTLIDRPGNQWQGKRRHGRSCHCHLQYSTLSQGYCENRGTPQLNLRKKNYRFLKQVQVSFCTKGRGGCSYKRFTTLRSTLRSTLTN